ncbi:hypothetical protein MGYG_06109 [Nannizzia gypsea CBS 118893]|uniref:Uncharacterized protein n=1 Tax=Arthroderma gypseum (strain ATCC MYA-4604 / CBS 118893) TaxID=535722 RepID=E4V0H7_ARTGP|nr:hypothetical protein MGYG_06109 [Nannizzia gypsea CBS 118893]EFR03114.1 hypothetical protein MGYG_06109 [Nannizzia gypsea CBS 118893]
MDRRPEIGDPSRSRKNSDNNENNHSISSFRSRSPTLSPSPPFNTQNRRLQLRNARFRGALLASASASASTPATASSSRQYHRQGHHSRRSSILRELGNSTQRRRSQHTSRVPVTSIFPSQPDSPPWSASFGRPKASVEDLDQTHDLEPDLDWEEKMQLQSTRKASISSQKSSTFTSVDRLKRPKGRNRDGRRDASQYIEHLENQLAATLQDAELADAKTHAARYKALNTEYRILRQELTEWEEKFEARVQDEEAAIAEREAQLKIRIRALEREVETKDNKIRELEWEVEKEAQNRRTLEAVTATNRSLERRVDVLTELLAQSPTRVELPPPPPASAVDGASSMPGGDGSMCRTPRPKSMFTKIPLSPVRQPLFHPTSEPDASFSDPCKRASGDEDSRSFELASVDSGFDSGPSHSQRTSLLSSQSGPGSATSFPLSPELQLQGKFQSRKRKMRRFPSGCCTLKPLVLPTASAALSPYAPPVNPSSSPSSIQQQRLARYFSTLRYSKAGSGYDESLYDDETDGDDADMDAARVNALDSLEGNTVHYQSFEEAMAGHDLSFDDMDEFGHSPFAPAKGNSPGSEAISYEGEGTVRRRRNRNRQTSTLRIDIGPVSRIFSAGQHHTSLSWLEKLQLYIPQLLANTRTLTCRILSNAWHSNWRRLGGISWWFLGLLLGTHTRNQWARYSTIRSARCVGGMEKAGTEADREPSTPVSVNHHRPDTAASLPACCTFAMQEWLKFSVTLVLAIGLAIRDGPSTLICPCPLPENNISSDLDADAMLEPEVYPSSPKYQSVRTSLSVLSPSALPRDDEAFDNGPD